MSHDELERFEKLCTDVEWATPYANATDDLKDRRASPSRSNELIHDYKEADVSDTLTRRGESWMMICSISFPSSLP
jgi:hypothetical protein